MKTRILGEQSVEFYEEEVKNDTSVIQVYYGVNGVSVTIPPGGKASIMKVRSMRSVRDSLQENVHGNRNSDGSKPSKARSRKSKND
jgi:hypothetical protein